MTPETAVPHPANPAEVAALERPKVEGTVLPEDQNVEGHADGTLVEHGKMRLLDHAPPACSSCYLQRPDVRHVDFGAAWDGPVMEGSVKVAIDDLIVCEDCLRTAVALIGITGDVEELQDELRLAQRERQDEAERRRGLEQYVQRLEAAFAARPEPEADEQ